MIAFTPARACTSSSGINTPYQPSVILRLRPYYSDICCLEENFARQIEDILLPLDGVVGPHRGQASSPI